MATPRASLCARLAVKAAAGLLTVAVSLCACPSSRAPGGGDDAAPAPAVPGPGGSAAPAVPGPGGSTAPAVRVRAPAPIAPGFGPGIRSLRVRHAHTAVLSEPRRGAPVIGQLEKDARVPWLRVTVPKEGRRTCRRWVALVPRGHACETAFEPSADPPDETPLPHLTDGAIAPGPASAMVVRAPRGAKVYATVADAAADRPSGRIAGPVGTRVAEVSVRGRAFARIGGGALVAAAELERRSPSQFRGLRLDVVGAPRLPFAWLQHAGDPTAHVELRVGPETSARRARTIAPRTVAPVAGRSADGGSIRLGSGEWVAAVDARVARGAAPPPGLRPQERWLDADIDERVIVAYEGERPVYATLFSPGAPSFPTPTGVWRIDRKVAERLMGIDLPGVIRYRIPHVAWVQYFKPLYAIHVASWHDDFGEAVSHGCLNLSPLDARFLYAWAPPEVPAGWSEVRAGVASPGVLLRVRSRRHPEPAAVGYARQVR